MSASLEFTSDDYGSDPQPARLVDMLTSGPGRVVVAHVVMADKVNSKTSVVDGLGLTWNLRSRETMTYEPSSAGDDPDTSIFMTVESWYAIAAAEITDFATVTATFEADSTGDPPFRSIMVCYAVAGVDTSAPFDTWDQWPRVTQDATGDAVPIQRSDNQIESETGGMFLGVIAAYSTSSTAAPTPGVDWESERRAPFSGGSLRVLIERQSFDVATSGIMMDTGEDAALWLMVGDGYAAGESGPPAIEEALPVVTLVALF